MSNITGAILFQNVSVAYGQIIQDNVNSILKYLTKIKLTGSVWMILLEPFGADMMVMPNDVGRHLVGMLVLH